MSCGFPLRTAIGGFFSAWLIRSVFLVGGAAPLVLSLFLSHALPESLRYMLAIGYTAEKIKTKLAGTAVSLANSQILASKYQASTADRQTGLKVLLSPTYIIGSLTLWTAFFMGLIIFYGSVNWMPVLLRQAGLDF
jgi:MFS transporter, AAHS family, 4-hydroxybenzoate transporter